MNAYRFSVCAARGDDGEWEACCPEFPECRASGPTYEAALANIREAIRTVIEDGWGDDEPVPRTAEPVFTAVELPASPSS